ncbi:hypothetical protein PHBOTO_004393 [Pseudozyma hubeiensis]|nr:hypothetical protein PHBOTO_004393 [Pseudozyma hubeiensis]
MRSTVLCNSKDWSTVGKRAGGHGRSILSLPCIACSVCQSVNLSPSRTESQARLVHFASVLLDDAPLPNPAVISGGITASQCKS